MYAAAATPSETSSPSKRAEPAAEQEKPKLLDGLREALRSRHYSRRTEQSYCQWACLPRREPSRRRQVKRFIFFHNVGHPAEIKGDRNKRGRCHLCHLLQIREIKGDAATYVTFSKLVGKRPETPGALRRCFGMC
jgi:hypothetical protein